MAMATTTATTMTILGIFSRHHGKQASVRLDTLPAEIHAMIFEHFAPQMPAFDDPRPRLQDVDRRQDTSKWEGKHFECVSTLRDLRLVSSRICSAITPLLLRSVLISSQKQFVRFLRFLLAFPHNAVYVRNLYILITLNSEVVAEALIKRITRDFETGAWQSDGGSGDLLKCFTHQFKAMTSRMSTGPGLKGCRPAEIAEFTLLCMLRAVPSLSQLTLQVPLRPDTPRLVKDEEGVIHRRPLWHVISQHANSRRADALRGDAADPFHQDSGPVVDDSVLSPWPALKRLQLRPDPVEHVYREKEHREHEIRLWENDILNYRLGQHRALLDAFPCLTALELASCGEVAMVGAEAAGYAHKGIQDIYLHNTSEGPRAIAHLLSPEITPHLRRVYVRQRPKRRFDKARLHAVDLEKEGKELNLNKALALRAGTMQELHLIFDYTSEYQYYVGPGMRLTCLPSLHRLRKLTIQLQLLLGHPKRLDPEPDLAELLPSGLVELTIRDDWAIDTIAREQRRRTQLGYPSATQIREVEGKFPNTVPDNNDYFCCFEHHLPYRTTIQSMLLRLASVVRYGRVDGEGRRGDVFPHLRAVTFQVLPSKVYRMDGGPDVRDPALQPMDMDLFKDPRRGFFTDPPRWVPLLGKDMWPKEHSELLDAIAPFFGEVRHAFEEAGVTFDWEGDARVWLGALRVAADADEGKKEESPFLQPGKDEDDEDCDGVGGAGRTRKRVARWIARLHRPRQQMR